MGVQNRLILCAHAQYLKRMAIERANDERERVSLFSTDTGNWPSSSLPSPTPESLSIRRKTRRTDVDPSRSTALYVYVRKYRIVGFFRGKKLS